MAEDGLSSMRPRTLTRYFAFRVLYQFSVTHESASRLLQQLWSSDDGRLADNAIRTFAQQLASLALEHLDTIDRFVEQYARQRALHRIPMVDLALLRLGAAELLYVSDVPPPVVIDEMVELAKRFSTEDSAAFINAVLDRIQAHRDDVPAAEKVISQWVSTRT